MSATYTPPTPATELGNGTITPILKISSILVAIHTAMVAEWPMDKDFISATLRETLDLTNLVLTPGWMTAGARAQITDWVSDTNALINAQLRRATSVDDLDILRAELESLIPRSWQLTTLLDRELVGLPERSIDAGRTL